MSLGTRIQLLPSIGVDWAHGLRSLTTYGLELTIAGHSANNPSHEHWAPEHGAPPTGQRMHYHYLDSHKQTLEKTQNTESLNR